MTLRSRILAALVLSLTPAPAGQADFNDVGKWMAIVLQNGHFSRQPFSEMSGRFLECYLKALDPAKVYFTRQDIDRFEKAYGDSLDDLLLKGGCMTAANDISRTWVQRVTARVEEAAKLLATPDFNFTMAETIPATRKEAAWPQDEAQAMEIWNLQVKAALLAEILRREGAADAQSPAEKLSTRYRRVLADAKEDSEPAKLAATFLSAVAQSFDPHSDYMSEREVELFNEDMRNEINGIGVMLQTEADGATRIRNLVRHGPADQQGGLQAGDRVIAIDPDGEGPREKVDILFMGVSRVSELIRGIPGTPLTLSVEPASGAAGVASVSLFRGTVAVEASQASAQLIRVKEDGVERKLGLITLPSFYRDFEKNQTACSVDVERLLTRLKSERIDGLLIDLRGNGGGSLGEVQRMTGFFTRPAPVVQVKDGLGETVVLESRAKEPLYAGPMVVLTDRGSASASEIFAAALQDDNRAVVVGDHATFGKGTVQVIKDLGEKMPFFAGRKGAGGLRLTVQKFYRPSGVSTQNRGVIPDIVVPGPDSARDGGESDLPFALQQDRIEPAPGFKPLDRNRLFTPKLAEKSAARVAASRDLGYFRQDALRLEKLIAANRVNLNLEERRKETEENKAIAQQREEERQGRFAGIVEADRQHLEIFPLKLAELANGAALRKADEEAPEPGEKGKALSWPSGLDPQKREAMAVLGDLIEATARAT
ncbi:carboxy terminal-processing peptidase [Haloferula sp. BvORR071]|uniref:carboxy terminal-processing peptidase n=1 Tax=Haloferula sp. BvORR071 TaxID=1396141 RepID=UPI0005505C4A|nr:carboxy terminal-processing peptidase [Haloferula sp. BvORR071]